MVSRDQESVTICGQRSLESSIRQDHGLIMGKVLTTL